MSATPDSTLDPQQLIAELQRQLAECRAERDRLRSERDEALEQQTATAEVLQVINSSPGDLKPVFEVMLEKARRLCEADGGTLWTFDGELFHPNTVSSAYNQRLREVHGGIRPSPNVALGAIMRGENVIH